MHTLTAKVLVQPLGKIDFTISKTFSSDRNHNIENTDEAPGSETETFPNSPAALMRTLRTTTRPQMPRLPRHLGHRACCDAVDEE